METSNLEALTGKIQKLFLKESTNVYSLFVGNQPVPASRPRVTKWGAHYGKTYDRWRRAARDFFFELDVLVHSPVIVVTEIIVLKARTSKREWPRGDNDNFEKAIWDAITKAEACWKDDDQIIANYSIKRFANEGEEPGFKVTVYEL